MNNHQLREEYISRINKVLDFIDQNIDKELTLDMLASVANFSRYHFHRIFSSILNESLFHYIQRVRLERAAFLLLENYKKSITEIALDTGFSSSATFARAFREFFGMSASDWRSGGYKGHSNIGKMNSNSGKQPGKESKASNDPSNYISSVDYYNYKHSNWRIQMKGNPKFKANVEVKELEEKNLVYVRHIGPYAGNSDLFASLFNKLFTWAGPRGLLNFPQTQIMSIYHDNPEITDEEKLRTSIAITAPEDTRIDGDIGMMKLAGGKYGIARFELKNDEYPDAWNAVFAGWLPGSGYQPDDRPSFEIYHNDPKEHPEGKCIVDICVPVKPL